MFPCDKCGECCRHVYLSPFYKDLDRGDGVCRYLKKNLCSIYERRPLKCRIDACYEKFFKHKMTRQEFYRLNLEYCQKLKQMRR